MEKNINSETVKEIQDWVRKNAKYEKYEYKYHYDDILKRTQWRNCYD